MDLQTLVFFTIMTSKPVFATLDLNMNELQYVADHLSIHECRRVSEALHDKHFILFHNVTGESELDLPCIDLLIAWNNGEGKYQTYIALATRLRETDHKELADKLSRMVNHEKSEAVRTAFLSDPFKNMIHTNSPLLDESVIVGPTMMLNPPTKAKKFDKKRIVWIVTGVILGSLAMSCFGGLVFQCSAWYREDKEERLSKQPEFVRSDYVSLLIDNNDNVKSSKGDIPK